MSWPAGGQNPFLISFVVGCVIAPPMNFDLFNAAAAAALPHFKSTSVFTGLQSIKEQNRARGLDSFVHLSNAKFARKNKSLLK